MHVPFHRNWMVTLFYILHTAHCILYFFCSVFTRECIPDSVAERTKKKNENRSSLICEEEQNQIKTSAASKAGWIVNVWNRA